MLEKRYFIVELVKITTEVTNTTSLNKNSFMKAFIQIFSFLCLATSAFPLLAQKQAPLDNNANIDWSAEYNEPNNSFLSKVVHYDEAGFYALRVQNLGTKRENPKVYIEYYDKQQMKLKKSAELDLKFKKKTRDFEDLIVVGDNMYLLTSFNNQAKKKNYLFAQSVSLSSLRPSQKLIKLAEVETKNAYQEGGFRHHLSKDDSKVLIYSVLPKQKKEPERFYLQVFDNQLNALWEKKVRLPFNDDRFSVEEYQVDNEGNVYMLGVVYQDKTRFRRGGKPTYQYVVLAYREDGEAVEEYKVNLNEKFITDLTFRVAKNGDLVFSGFYSELGTYSVKGTYFFRLNPTTKEIYNKNLKAFDFDFLTEFLSEKQTNKAKKAAQKGNVPELYQYSLDDLILRSDGGAVLVAEQYYVERRYNNDNYYSNVGFGGFNRFNRFGPFYSPYNNNFNDDYEYHYNDIIVVNIQPNGEIEWTARVPKQQITTNDGGYFSSYAMSIVKDKFYFVYNDNYKNFDPSKKGKFYSFSGRNAVITLAEINKNGAVVINPLFSDTDASITTRPKVCKQIGRDEMLIYGERGRNYRFGNLIFE